jgi:OmpA-OmpF porin, OOP family
MYVFDSLGPMADSTLAIEMHSHLQHQWLKFAFTMERTGGARMFRAWDSRVLMLASCVALLAATGCTTKNYVRTQTAPLAQKTNELDSETATNTRYLNDLSTRVDTGVAQAQSAANQANQNAQSASSSAITAQGTATDAVNRVNTLQGAVANLDNYQELADANVLFAFGSAELTKKGKQDLDDLGARIADAKGYILEVTGSTDSIGGAEYNYELSERRAQAVVQYLAVKYDVAPHRFYLIGVGKDMAKGGKQAHDRKVEVRLLSNRQGATPAATPAGY